MLLLRGATAPRKADTLCPPCFNTCSSCEEQLGRAVRTEGQERVSIHAPLARSNFASNALRQFKQVSIHAPLARSNSATIGTPRKDSVSIHAPLARSNSGNPIRRSHSTGFNTCSSCEEQLLSIFRKKQEILFQYMLLLRGATKQQLKGVNMMHVSIHAPLARSNFWKVTGTRSLSVSIHAPLARSNNCRPEVSLDRLVSIHAPLARSNAEIPVRIVGALVSIHAPLARSNMPCVLRVSRLCSFNTCSSCEEQLIFLPVIVAELRFQYMLLLRGATGAVEITDDRWQVSIHAPLARSNDLSSAMNTVIAEFQYMLLLRGATFRGLREPRFGQVSIHAPLARSNLAAPAGLAELQRFNTCSSCEEQLGGTMASAGLSVSIHAPLARSNSR